MCFERIFFAPFLLAVWLCPAYCADEPPSDERPTWHPLGSSHEYKGFLFTVPVMPKGRLPENQQWNSDGWTEIRAMVEPRHDGPSDTRPKLAFGHGFHHDFGWLWRAEEQRVYDRRSPRAVSYPPSPFGGKNYFLPIHGYLFEGREPENQSITFTWVPQRFTPKDIPKVKRDSLCIPLRYRDYPSGLTFGGDHYPQPEEIVTMPSVRLLALSITPATDAKNPAKAEIACEGIPIDYKKVGVVTVREGDILVVPGYFGFIVRHIVPRSEKTLAIGWIDLDSHLIEEKDLEAKAKKEGREIVRFNMKRVAKEQEDDESEPVEGSGVSWWWERPEFLVPGAVFAVIGCAAVVIWRGRQ